MSTYLETYPTSLTDGLGLVYYISSLENCPWYEKFDPEDIERLYSSRSGNKNLSSLVSQLDGRIEARLILAMFGEKWKKLLNTFELEYNPLDAYIVSESGEKNRTDARTSSTTYGKTRNESTTASTDSTEVTTENSDGFTGIYGFNSDNPVNSDTSEDNSESNFRNETDSTGSRSVTDGGSDSKTGNGTEDETYSYKKTGNIGYSSPQELIQGEFDIWKIPYFTIVFQDIDSYIMVSVWD